MKAAVAILFSVLLVLAQSILPGNAALTRTRSPEAPCTCGKSCCVAQSDSAPAPLPAAPASTVSLKLSHGVLVRSTPLLSPPVLSLVGGACPVSFSVRSDTVPLYEWNCAYLI